jgi:hypothetical protein
MKTRTKLWIVLMMSACSSSTSSPPEPPGNDGAVGGVDAELPGSGGIADAGATGGGGSSGSPDSGVAQDAGGEAHATFAWHVFDIEDSAHDAPLPCAEVGAASVTVALTEQATGVTYTQGPAPCADGRLTTASLPAGAYAATFSLYGDPAIYGDATILLDRFLSTTILDLQPGANDFTDTYAPFLVQALTVSWELSAQSAPVTCASVGATYVDLEFSVTDTTTWVTSQFDCASGSGISYAVPLDAGMVPWRLRLLDATGTDLQLIDGDTVTFSGRSDARLGTQTFSF